MDHSPPRSSAHGGSPGKNTGVGCHFLLQITFPTRDQTLICCVAGGFFTTEPPGKPSRFHQPLTNLPTWQGPPPAPLQGALGGSLTSHAQRLDAPMLATYPHNHHNEGPGHGPQDRRKICRQTQLLPHGHTHRQRVRRQWCERLTLVSAQRVVRKGSISVITDSVNESLSLSFCSERRAIDIGQVVNPQSILNCRQKIHSLDFICKYNMTAAE